MIGAPPTKSDIADRIDTLVRHVDQVGRAMEERWGLGRLPTLVPLEWAERFRSQRRKFTIAVDERNLDDCIKHGEAMLRAYVRLSELAVEAGHDPVPPDQWEFEGPDGLIVLVRDIRRTNQVRLDGRKAQVWSVDEIANVIRLHPILAKAKECFDGATVDTIRPSADIVRELADEIPF